MPPAPVPDALVQLLDGERVVAETRSDTTGAFRLRAAPGHYALRAATTAGYRTETTVEVDLGTDGEDVAVLLDSGIR